MKSRINAPNQIKSTKDSDLIFKLFAQNQTSALMDSQIKTANLGSVSAILQLYHQVYEVISWSNLYPSVFRPFHE